MYVCMISCNDVTAKDLIRGLLKTDQDERLTITEVMRNKWIAVSHPDMSVTSTLYYITCISFDSLEWDIILLEFILL